MNGISQKVQRAYNQVRLELWEVGLLANDKYLDEIRLEISGVWSFGEAGYVFDRGVPPHLRLLGWEEGIIYLPSNSPYYAYVPGGTIADTIRHEYAHSWAWIDWKYFERPWFRQAFKSAYYDQWEHGPCLWKVYGKDSAKFQRSPFFGDYVTAYALTAPCEDFAETFFTFLRYRKSLSRFRGRPGVMDKLQAVRKAVETKAKVLGLS